MDENVKVKAKFKGASRRFELASSSTWNELVLQLCSLFYIQDGHQIHVKYCDDENELVSLSSQVELDEAIRLTKRSSRLLYLHIDDPTSLEEKHAESDVKEQELKNGKSSCYSDLASAMAEELSALNKRLEKSITKNSTKKEDTETQQNKAMDDQMKSGEASSSPVANAVAPELVSSNQNTSKSRQKEMQKPLKQKEEKKERKEKKGNNSCYSELARAMAPDLSSVNERMTKKDREVRQPPVQLQQDKKENQKEKNSKGSCYSELASAIAPERSSLNERMTKKDREVRQPPKQLQQDKKENQKEKNSSGSCYSELASAIAPELSSLNERMTEKNKETPQKAETCETSDDSIPMPLLPEPPKSSYINLGEMMAQSNNVDGSAILNSSNSIEEQRRDSQSSQIGASRDWFGHFEEHLAESAPKKNKTAKKTKKQGCYSELAESVADELRNMTIKETQTTGSRNDVSDSTLDDRAEAEPCSVPPPINMNFEAKRQLDGQCEKKPKKPKKHNKSKKCYSELADDISPMFQAMNKRLEEQQKKEAVSQKAKQPKVTPLSSSPESVGEPFVFVSNNDDLSSFHYSSLEIVDSGTSDEPNCNSSSDSVEEIQSTEQRVGTESNLISFHEENQQDAPAVNICGDIDKPAEGKQEDMIKVECHDHATMDNTRDPSQTICDLVNEVPLTSKIPQDEAEDSSPHATTSCEAAPQSQEKSQDDMKKIVQEVLKDSMEDLITVTMQRLQTTSNMPVTPCNTPAQENVTPRAIVVHKDITCDNCGVDVHGIRYKCCNCKEFDLCETCEDITGIHNMEHVFVKLRYPSPGIGCRHGEMVPIFKKSVYKRSCEKKQKERELRRAAREAEKERKRALKEQKHALKAREKERKKKEKAKSLKIKKDKQDTGKIESSNVHDRLKAVFVSDANYPDGTVVLPGQKFMKTWVIRNAGDIAWNQWITLACIEGSIMGFPLTVPFLKPGTQDEVSVEFVAPEIPGIYTSKWQLCYGMYMFGPMLWCEIKVPDRKELEEPEMSIHHDQYSLVDTAFKKEKFSEPEVKLIHENVQRNEIYDDGSSSEYLSPEESPDRDSLSSSPETKKDISLASVASGVQQRQDLEWDAGCMHDLEVVKVKTDNADMLIETTRNIDNWSFVDSDDSDGEESDSSLDEFTVLVPTCFDPEAPLTAEPFPVKVTDVKPYKKCHNFTSPFYNSLAVVDPGCDEYGLPNLPYNTSLSDKEEEKSPDTATATIMEQTSSPTVDEPLPDSSLSNNTPSVSPNPLPIQEPVIRDPPVSTQPSISPRGGIPLVTQPTTVMATSTIEEKARSDSNIVSEVFNTAVGVVTSAGKAALETVDNFFSGSSQTTATYTPQTDEITLNPRGANMDAPPPPPLVWPIDRSPSTNSMDRLIEMGFGDRRLNQRLLQKHKDDISATIEELLNHQENDWSSQRH